MVQTLLLTWSTRTILTGRHTSADLKAIIAVIVLGCAAYLSVICTHVWELRRKAYESDHRSWRLDDPDSMPVLVTSMCCFAYTLMVGLLLSDLHALIIVIHPLDQI